MPALRSIAKTSKIDSIRDRLHPYKSTHKSIDKPSHPPPSSPRNQTHDSTSPCSPPSSRNRPHTLAGYIDLWDQGKVSDQHGLERMDGLYTYDEEQFEESTMTQANDLFFRTDLSWGAETGDDAEPEFGESDEEGGVRGRQRDNAQDSEAEDIANEATTKIFTNPVTIRAGVEPGEKVKFDMTMQEVQDWAGGEEDDGEWEEIDDTDAENIATIAADNSTTPSKSDLEKAKAILKETNASFRSISLASIYQHLATVATAAKDSLVQAASRPHPPPRYERPPRRNRACRHLARRDLARRQLPLTPDERARVCSGFCLMTIGSIIVVACLYPACLMKTLTTLAAVVLAVIMLGVGMLGWKGAVEKVKIGWREMSRVWREDGQLRREQQQLKLEAAAAE